MTLKFKALESALIIEPHNQGHHNTTSNEPNYDPNRDPNSPNRNPNSSGHSLDDQILSLIKKQGDITRARLSLELGVSESTIKRAFKKLLTK
ncbi:winged helix-turn-helix transcriptional regulator [Succinivibrio dextrinosolvens]|uniref:winged helix-turn-helix transcriptional regulator n=1 Tax=Succinivibrio dextrinosolvens TaxID=83771 RepID=UPI002479A42B|nr:winged helix-turn-helix transcriptional regulator [Succinivibrio dextrinosolvens]